MAYSLHKRGIEGADIQCDCGVTLKNHKRARHYHCHKNSTHIAWLSSIRQGPGEHELNDVDGAVAAEGTKGDAPEDELNDDDGDVAAERTKGDAPEDQVNDDDTGPAALESAASVQAVLVHESAAKSDLLALKIVELRDMCKRKGVSTAGAKHVLVDRLCNLPALNDDAHDAGATVVTQPPVIQSISDSLMDNIHDAAPFDASLTPMQNAVRLGNAATDALLARKGAAQKWEKIQHNDEWLTKCDAWSSVECMPSDFLPNFTEENLCGFKVNQFCEECRALRLCPTHQRMTSKANVDLTAKHMAAIKASGCVLVECGGDGDCFYHSMMFLARRFRQDLYHRWGSHSKMRQDACQNLLVSLHFKSSRLL
jgi:hypothetical protein